MIIGDLYYINQKGEQILASKNIPLMEAKQQVKTTKEITNHINFMSNAEICHQGDWLFLIHGKGWKTL